MFVDHEDAAYNYGPSVFDIEEVHKIGILDIRILNADRNDENILLKTKSSSDGNQRL